MTVQGRMQHSHHPPSPVGHAIQPCLCPLIMLVVLEVEEEDVCGSIFRGNLEEKRGRCCGCQLCLGISLGGCMYLVEAVVRYLYGSGRISLCGDLKVEKCERVEEGLGGVEGVWGI